MSGFITGRVESAKRSLIERAKATLRKNGEPCPDTQAAEIERLREWNRQMVEKSASGGVLDGYREMGAKLAAAEAEAERLRERIAAACEMAEGFYHHPQGTLWNHGTTPSARDHAEWKGVRNTAQDLLYALDPDRALAALHPARAALTERKP